MDRFFSVFVQMRQTKGLAGNIIRSYTTYISPIPCVIMISGLKWGVDGFFHAVDTLTLLRKLRILSEVRP